MRAQGFDDGWYGPVPLLIVDFGEDHGADLGGELDECAGHAVLLFEFVSVDFDLGDCLWMRRC